jgi:hypothetical protein
MTKNHNWRNDNRGLASTEKCNNTWEENWCDEHLSYYLGWCTYWCRDGVVGEGKGSPVDKEKEMSADDGNWDKGEAHGESKGYCQQQMASGQSWCNPVLVWCCETEHVEESGEAIKMENWQLKEFERWTDCDKIVWINASRKDIGWETSLPLEASNISNVTMLQNWHETASAKSGFILTSW